MLDEILYVSENQAYVYYTHRSPISVYSSTGDVMSMVDELLSPLNAAHTDTLTEYQRIEAASKEDTLIIPLDEIS